RRVGEDLVDEGPIDVVLGVVDLLHALVDGGEEIVVGVGGLGDGRRRGRRRRSDRRRVRRRELDALDAARGLVDEVDRLGVDPLHAAGVGDHVADAVAPRLEGRGVEDGRGRGGRVGGDDGGEKRQRQRRDGRVVLVDRRQVLLRVFGLGRIAGRAEHVAPEDVGRVFRRRRLGGVVPHRLGSPLRGGGGGVAAEGGRGPDGVVYV